MDTPMEKAQSKTNAMNLRLLKLKEVGAIGLAMRMIKVRAPVKLLVGLAAGAMLITATAFTYDQLRQDEAVSPSSSSQITETSQALAYWVQRDEAEEMLFDELSKNFVGIAAPSSQITETSQALAHWVQRDEAEEMAYDELSKSFVGIAYPSSENSQGLQAPASWVQRDEIERLESQIDRLLTDAALDPSLDTPLLDREIERLDYQIDRLRLNAMQNQSADVN